MGRIMVWDLPIRVFHWLFAGCCGAAMALALLGEDSRTIFSIHMIFGIAAGFVLILRIALGLAGNRNNRLPAMLFASRETLGYLVGVVTGRAPRYPVHNPATSTAALAMFLIVPVLALTGMNPGREWADEVHVLLAYGLLALIGAHLMGLAIHTVRHRENIASAMVSGRKTSPAGEGPVRSRAVVGALALIACLAWIGVLFTSYDPHTGAVVLPVAGITIRLQGSHEAEDR